MNKSFSIYFISLVLLLSGCMDNPMKEVPVIKVNITYLENQSFVEPIAYEFTQGNVTYLNRPKMEQAQFPAISGRTMIYKGKNSSIGEWEMLPYNGPGTYSFNIGFLKNNYPVPDDIVHISIYVVNEKGERIGIITKEIVWK